MKDMLFDKCSICGGKCCQNPKLTIKERDAILEYIKGEPIEKTVEFVAFKQYRFTLKNANGYEYKCPFLDSDGCTLPRELVPFNCKIYPAIPAEFSWDWGVHVFCPYYKDLPEAYIEECKVAIKENPDNVYE